MNDIIQDLEVNATNGKENFCYISEKQLKAMKELSKREAKENKQLKDNWNKLREWIIYNKHNENTEQHYLVVDYGTLLGKMQELEQGSDKDGSDKDI